MFYNKDKSLTKYSLSCGYIERIEKNEIEIELYYDSCCYHIKCYDHENRWIVFWYSEGDLTNARKNFYKQIKDFFGISRQKYLTGVTIKENRSEEGDNQ